MIKILNQSNKFFLIIIIAIIITNKSTFGSEAYFDLSDKEINIETDFNGKEVIIFGLTDPSYDTILIIKGPKKNIKLSMKERIFGFWLETKKIIYKDMPSILFIASSNLFNSIAVLETIRVIFLFTDSQLLSSAVNIINFLFPMVTFGSNSWAFITIHKCNMKNGVIDLIKCMIVFFIIYSEVNLLFLARNLLLSSQTFFSMSDWQLLD